MAPMSQTECVKASTDDIIITTIPCGEHTQLAGPGLVCMYVEIDTHTFESR